MSPKLLARNIVVVAGAFVWYFLAYRLVDESAYVAGYSDSKVIIVGAGTAGIAIFAFIGSLIAGKLVEKRIFLMSWMLAGVPLSLIPFCHPPSSLGELVAVSAIFGSYFGLGMPATMAYFASSTTTENRGRTAGITFLAIGVSFSFLGFFLNFSGGESQAIAIALPGIRLASLILFILVGAKEDLRQQVAKSAYGEIVRNRAFVLYFIPWIMFNIVDYLTITITGPPDGVSLTLASAIENGLIAVCAIAAGFLIDTKGRKRPAIFGFAFLAIGYASLGLFPNNATGWVFYTISDGIAWGIFNVVFLFTLWGDITNGKNSEKTYVLGALPFILSNFIYALVENSRLVGRDQVFTFASLFLFLAVLPLVFAPETLPEKVMKDLELRTYLKRAKEIAAKSQEREALEKDSSVEFHVVPEDDEDVEKLEEEHY